MSDKFADILEQYKFRDAFTIHEVVCLWQEVSPTKITPTLTGSEWTVGGGLPAWYGFPRWYEEKYKTIQIACSNFTGQQFLDKSPAYSRKCYANWFQSKGVHPQFLFPDGEIKAGQSLDPRNKRTLHCLIAVLAKNLNYSPDDQDTTGKIKKLLDNEGVSMNEKTIRTNIKEAFKTLNERRE